MLECLNQSAWAPEEEVTESWWISKFAKEEKHFKQKEQHVQWHGVARKKGRGSVQMDPLEGFRSFGRSGP